MAKGIYSSGLSCWQRARMGLPQDTAGPETIDAEKPVVEEVKKEDKKEDKKNKTVSNSTKSSLSEDKKK